MARYERRDRYYRKARERGLPSRAAFKIEELIRGGIRGGNARYQQREIEKIATVERERSHFCLRYGTGNL